MAVQTITIDERIKCVGASSVFDYNGTLYVLDQNGLKIFDGTQLRLINALRHRSGMNAVIVGDFIYYMYQYYLYRYNITTNTTEQLAQASKTSSYVYTDMFYYNNKIYIVLYYDSTSDSYYTQAYNLETSSFEAAKSLGFSYSGEGNMKVQVAVVGDTAYFRVSSSIRAYKLPDLTSYVSYSASALYGRYLAGAYVHENEYVCTLGYKSGYKNGIYSFDFNTSIGEEQTVDIPADNPNVTEHFVGVWDGAYCIATPSGLIKIKYVTYDLTYNFYDFTGENALVNLTGKYPTYKVLFNKSGNSISYTLTTIDGVVSGAFDYEPPQGKQITGIALQANSKRPTFSFGITYDVSINESTNFYLSIGTYRPPATTFDINLYQSSAEVNRVDKTDYLTSVGTLSGALREECSIIAPSITFRQTTVPTFNYVYIAAFGRYYYVTGITSVSKDIWRMSLSCDVLMTWKDDIGALTAIIARQENSFNPLLLDSELPAQANQNITVTEFPAGGFNTADAIEYPFVLTVVGA